MVFFLVGRVMVIYLEKIEKYKGKTKYVYFIRHFQLVLMFYFCTLHAMCSKFWLWYNQILHMNFWRNIKRARNTCCGSSKSKPSVRNIRKIINNYKQKEQPPWKNSNYYCFSAFFFFFLIFWNITVFSLFSFLLLVCPVMSHFMTCLLLWHVSFSWEMLRSGK